MPSPQETCVVTVTYGTRHEYVRDLIDGARQNGAGHIVFVDNGSDAASSQQLTRMAEDDQSHRITILPLGENRGSAVGFKQGLRYVYEQTSYPYVWLSDADLRLFYNTRNKVYYEVHQRENSRAMLAVNEAVFWVLLYVISFLYRAPTRRQLVKKAVLDGKRAILGKVRWSSDSL